MELNNLALIDDVIELDSRCVSIAEQALQKTGMIIEDGLGLDNLQDAQAQNGMLEAALARFLTSRDARTEAMNHLAHANLKLQRAMAREIENMQAKGELLTPGRPDKCSKKEQLSNFGIDRKNNHMWQTQALVPDDKFEEWVAEKKETGYAISDAGLYRLGKQYRPIKELKREPVSGIVKLFVAQCEDMPLEDETIDLIITSPPYNLGSEYWPMGGDGRTARADGIGYKDEMDEDEYQDWQIACLNEMYRVAREGATLFYNHKVRQKGGTIIHPMDWLRRSEWVIRQEIVWDRKSTHNHNPHLFWPQDERIYWLTKGKPAIGERGIGLPSVWREFGPVPNASFHPAPFPESLPRMCMNALCRDEGLTVLDPFAGGCTTLRVALEYGYEAIGIDVHRGYLEQAIEENLWQVKLD